VNLAQVLSARELVEAVLNMHQDEQRKVITFFCIYGGLSAVEFVKERRNVIV
jgi:hypothetical protein